jgi:putative membrane protein
MFKWIANWILNALALYIVSRMITGISIPDFTTALWAIVIISLINILLKPLLILLTLPINIITLGLFTLIVNAILFSIAANFTPGFSINGFGSALLGSILYSFVSSVLRSLVN